MEKALPLDSIQSRIPHLRYVERNKHGFDVVVSEIETYLFGARVYVDILSVVRYLI